MIYSLQEYAEKFLICGKKVSAMTVRRRCEKGMLPSNHHAKKLPGETGMWIIEVIDEVVETKEVIKEKPQRSLSTRFISWQ
jgi:hypothetical protein